MFRRERERRKTDVLCVRRRKEKNKMKINE